MQYVCWIFLHWFILDFCRELDFLTCQNGATILKTDNILLNQRNNFHNSIYAGDIVKLKLVKESFIENKTKKSSQQRKVSQNVPSLSENL